MQDPNPTQMGWAAPPQQAQPQAEQPLLLARYRVVETRGTGGFGAVHVCWDTRLERRVAIKCMPLTAAPGMSSSTLAEALDEARITSRLTHPNIVTVHDFAVEGSVAYLIMEYVNGLTLAELMSRVEGGVLTYDECAHVLSSLAAALDFAHANGVLHLDIKPSNVFIDGSGIVKLGDFGMASLSSVAGWEGARGGTVGYMPPEQLEGGLVDERTDIFALGVVCYQALTGTSPFAAKDAEASRKKIERGAKPLGKVEGELAGPVSDLLGRAISADPSERPNTAGELAKQVVPYLGDEDEGRASVASLVAQANGEPDPNAEAWEQAAHVSARERWPWLPVLCARGSVALACAGVAARVAAPLALAADIDAPPAACQLVAAGALALLGGLLPSAGGMVASAVAVCSMLCGGMYSPAFLVALLAAAGLVAWHVAFAAGQRLGPAALLMPAALCSPYAAPALAAGALKPQAALATALLGGALGRLMPIATTAPDGEQFAQAALGLATSPATWICLAGCALAAWLGSALGARRGGARGMLGQVACLATLVGTQLLSARVENGGVWGPPAAGDLGVALGCSVLVIIVISTLGPLPSLAEDE